MMRTILPYKKSCSEIQLYKCTTQRKFNSNSIVGTIIFLLLGLQIHAQTKADLIVQINHAERISCMAVNAAGSLLATGGEDRVVKIWNIQSGLLIRSMYGLRAGVRGICFSDAGDEILAGDWYGNLISWNMFGETKYKQKFEDAISAIQKANTKNEAVVVMGNIAYELNIATKKLTKLIESKEGKLKYAVYSSDDKMIAVCKDWYQKENIGLIKNGNSTWFNIGESANHIAFCSNNGKIAWSSGGIGTGKYGLLNISNGKLDWIKEGRQDVGGFENVAVVDKNTLAIASARSGMITVNMSDGSVVNSYKQQSGSVSTLISKNDFLLSAGSDRSIIKWDVTNMQPLLSIATKSDYVWGLSLAKDGKTLAAACGAIGKEQSVKIWDISTGRFIKRINDLSSDVDIISGCQFSPNQKYLGACTEAGKLVYWEYPEMNIAANYQVGTKPMRSVSFHPRSNYVAAVTTDGNIVTERVKTNSTTNTATGNGANSFCFSPDGNSMLVGTDKGYTQVWDFNTKTKVIEWPTHTNVGSFFDTATYIPFGTSVNVGLTGNKSSSGNMSASVNCVAWSKDGKTIGAAGASRITWIDVRSKTIVGANEGLHGVACFVFAPNDLKVAVGSADHNVRIIDLVTGEVTHTLVGHENEVRSVQFTPDGKYVISGSLDSQIKIWELTTGKCLLSFITLSASNEFIIYNPDGYYLSSKGAGKVLAFRVGNDVYPFPQFDLKYNRPDIIIEALQTIFGTTEELAPLKDAYNKAYQKRLQKMNFTEADINSGELHLPTLTINKTVNKGNSLEVNINATDSKYLLNRIQVYADDVPLYGSKGIDVKAQKSKQLTQTLNIDLVDGLNNIQLSCINEKGVESLRLPIKVSGKMDGKPNLYLIAISVSKYKDASMNLGYAVKDGKDMLHYFSSIKEQYNIVYTDSLFDENATVENITALKNKLLKTNANDAVVVFVSGHGLLDKDNSFYYATHDVDFTNPSLRGLPYDALENIVDGIPARKKLLLIDACHSGEVDAEMIDTAVTTATATSDGTIKTTGFRGVSLRTKKKAGLKNSFEMMQDLFTNLSQGSGALVISAAAGVGFALESSEWNNGLFTYAVLKTLKDKAGDANKNKHISVNELKTNVTKEVERLSNGKQKPTTRRELLEWDWDLN